MSYLAIHDVPRNELSQRATFGDEQLFKTTLVPNFLNLLQRIVFGNIDLAIFTLSISKHTVIFNTATLALLILGFQTL
jgi:hypothetical protein